MSDHPVDHDSARVRDEVVRGHGVPFKEREIRGVSAHCTQADSTVQSI